MKYCVYDATTDEIISINGKSEFNHLSDAEDASMMLNFQLHDALATEVRTVFEYGDE
jgi:hypothetical protein